MGTAFVSVAVALIAGLLTTGASAQATLNSFKQKAFLTCQSNPGLAGFSPPDALGNWTSLDFAEADLASGISVIRSQSYSQVWKEERPNRSGPCTESFDRPIEGFLRLRLLLGALAGLVDPSQEATALACPPSVDPGVADPPRLRQVEREYVERECSFGAAASVRTRAFRFSGKYFEVGLRCEKERMTMAMFAELISPERSIFAGEIQSVVLPGVEGDITILPGHAPLVTTLNPGFLFATDAEGKSRRAFIRGGFVEVTGSSVTILAERVLPVEELDSRNPRWRDPALRHAPRRVEGRGNPGTNGHCYRAIGRVQGQREVVGRGRAPAVPARPLRGPRVKGHVREI